MIFGSIKRPLHLLFTEPVLIAITLFIGFAWGVLYLLLISLPLVLETVYGFNIGEVGLAFNTQVVGSCLGLVIDHWCDAKYKQNVDKRGPEARLYIAMVASVLIPLGCWLYVFTSYSSIHWIVPLIGLTIIYAGLLGVYLACFNYLADAYTLYASSALSAQNCVRNLIGGERDTVANPSQV